MKEEHDDAVVDPLDAPTPNVEPEAEAEVIQQTTPPPFPDEEAHSEKAASPTPAARPRKYRAGQSRPEREAAQPRRLKLDDEFLADFDPHSD